MSFKKDINLVEKYPRLKLDKYIISNLRFLKNEKNLYLKKPFQDIFTDINNESFYNTLLNYKNDGRQSFFETLLDEIDNINLICERNEKNKIISVSLFDYLNKYYISKLSLVIKIMYFLMIDMRKYTNSYLSC